MPAPGTERQLRELLAELLVSRLTATAPCGTFGHRGTGPAPVSTPVAVLHRFHHASSRELAFDIFFRLCSPNRLPATAARPGVGTASGRQ